MKKKNAQQIMEFILVLPLLIIFFVILTEFAFAFNANLVLTTATKSAIYAYLENISTDSEKIFFESAIEEHIKNELKNNGLPNLQSLETNLITVETYPTIITKYTYNPNFKVVFLPALKNINMSAVSILPFKGLDLTGYENALSTAQVEMIQPQAVEEEEP